jgi:hypothetical protein
LLSPVGLVTPETDRGTGKKAYTWAVLHPRPMKKKLTDSIVPVMDGIRRKRSQ